MGFFAFWLDFGAENIQFYKWEFAQATMQEASYGVGYIVYIGISLILMLVAT